MEENILQPTKKIFYMSEEKYATISERNKIIAHKYIDSLINGTEKLSKATIEYNSRIICFTLRHIKSEH